MTAPWTRLRAGWQRFWFAPVTGSPSRDLIAFGVVATVWMLSLVPVLGPFFGRGGVIPHGNCRSAGGRSSHSSRLAADLGAVAGGPARRGRPDTRIPHAPGGPDRLRRHHVGDPLVLRIQRRGRADAARRLLSAPHAGGIGGVGGPVACRPRTRWNFPRRAPWALRLAQIQLSVIYISTVWEKAGGALLARRHGGVLRGAYRRDQPCPGPVVRRRLAAPHPARDLRDPRRGARRGILVWNRRPGPGCSRSACFSTSPSSSRSPSASSAWGS